MAAKSKTRSKHIPQRTCVGCREVLPKRQLIRVVRVEEGVKIDPTGKLSGRGAYLHDLKSCWVKGLKGSLAGALRTTISGQDLVTLTAYMESLPAEPVQATGSTVSNPPDKDKR
ncbi:MAG: YlxR family protein [Anaerolineaceae bacterium]